MEQKALKGAVLDLLSDAVYKTVDYPEVWDREEVEEILNKKLAENPKEYIDIREALNKKEIQEGIKTEFTVALEMLNHNKSKSR
jgi:hypothetical protein